MSLDASIILCTINEFETLPKVVSKIEGFVNFNYEIIFVDDNSTDGTRDFILDYERKHGNAKHIFNDSKRSLLIANYQGINAAEGKYIIIMDADLQHPAEKINDIYKKLNEGYDIVVASRYTDGGSPGNRKPVRGLISRVASALAKTYIRNARKITDPLSGFFGFRRGLRLDIDDRWRGYKTLLFLIASNPDINIGEIPYRFIERDRGNSKIVNGIDFIRIYLTELFLIKRVEIKSMKKKNSTPE
jgi:dolichol-phosphate mannosyltransferase